MCFVIFCLRPVTYCGRNREQRYIYIYIHVCVCVCVCVCRLKKICPACFRETCPWLKFPLNGLRAQSRVSPVVGLLPLASGSETWTIKARDARRITAAEMKYMRRTAVYTWTDYKTNAQIAKELKITPVLDKLLEYKRSRIQHVNRMPRNRLPRVMKYCSPTDRRNHGRPLKRLQDT